MYHFKVLMFDNIILFANLYHNSQGTENRNTYILGKTGDRKYMCIFKRIIRIVHDTKDLLRSDNIYMCSLHPTNNELLSCFNKKKAHTRTIINQIVYTFTPWLSVLLK